jgi:hypothetical protein
MALESTGDLNLMEFMQYDAKQPFFNLDDDTTDHLTPH